MKKFLALVLALVMTMSLVTVGASAKTDFTDDAKITNAEAVEVLNAMGVLTGYADGSFRPQAVLTRGAGAKIIAYLVLGQAKADKLAATYTVFEDVTDSVGLAAYIEWAAANGIVDGYGDGNFGPYNQLTEYAFGKMLLTALGYSSAKEGYTGAGWQKAVYTEAVRNGIFDGTESYGACDRETAARMALGALQSDIVAYGSEIIGGKFVWNGHTISGLSAAIVDGAVKTGKTLGSLYGVSKAGALDIFDRPGHTWSYKTWSKFYMDAPVAEYVTKVSECTILVDCGIAKTSKAALDVNYKSVNGVHDFTEADLDHKTCTGYHGGQGVLTQVFDTADGYVITEIDTYLAKVTGVMAAKHGKIGDEAKLEVYYKAQGDATSETVWVEDVTGLTKGDYILVNIADNTLAAYNYVAADDLSIYGNTMGEYINILGAASSFEGKLTAKGTEAAMTLTIGGKDYAAANEYALSASKLALGSTQKWFVDQYGNVIGDIDLASEAPKYGRVDALKWVNDGDVAADEYVSANLVAADATEAKVVLGDWNDKVAGGADSWSTVGFSGANYWVGEVKADNAKYYAKANNYGVVGYYSDYDVFTAGELLDNTTALTNGQVLLGTASGTRVYADTETQFLVFLGFDADGNEIYKAYTGINELPTIKNITDVVVVASAYNGVQAYAEFVFVYAPNAIYAGATTEAWVFNTNYVKANLDGTYEYTVWVGTEETTIVSKNAALFTAGQGMYDVSFNADTVALSAVACPHYSTATAVKQNGTGTVNNMNVAGATVYYVDWANSAIAAYTAAEIADGDTIAVKDVNADKVVEVIYVIDLADDAWFGGNAK